MSQPTTFRDFLAALPPEAQDEIARQAGPAIRQEADRQALRAVVERSGAEGAARMQADPEELYRAVGRAAIALRNLRRFVEQAGGELDAVVRLPGQAPIRLDQDGQ